MKSSTHKPNLNTQNPKIVHHMIGGVPVEFPYQPYGTQLAFMGRVIATLDRAHREGHCHALLESPTGTGKSLSLLCSALAWQKHRGAAPRNLNADVSQSRPDPKAQSDPLNYGGGFVPESQPSVSPGTSLAPDSAASTTNGKSQQKKAVPTIFYASRTHTQISQVIREYQKTTYRVPMAVLASRKHYCTNPRLHGRDNLDEECKLLLQNREDGCLQFKNATKVKCHHTLQKGGYHEVHDIEDLVKVGQRVKGCSYFAARSMAEDAQLVFCPYSYIINPTIRRAMEVDIKGAVIILDEAHNIEDIAREAGSVEVDEDSLQKLQTELCQLCLADETIYQPLYEMVQDMIGWMERRKSTLEKREFQHHFSCWTGENAVRELQEANISQQCFPILQECATKAIKAASDTESGLAHLSGGSSMALEGLFSSLSYFFLSNGAHINDYQLVLQRFVKRDAGGASGYWTHTFSLWCLNPAVIFRDMADLSLSVILTSGTLSPMSSFQSELGVQFGTCLEAPHVVDVESQVWAAVLSSGPGTFPLNASYKTADAYEFQDALGKTLEEIYRVVPGGCLVFFPSYKLMDKLCSRWHETGQWSHLNARKHIFIEPRGGNQDDFEPILKGYYDSILKSDKPCLGRRRKVKKLDSSCCSASESPDTCKDGAAFLAVCRGKVSEGIDFSDENARAVIIVGIPFPNINDIQVAQKKKFNDAYKYSKNLLSGSDWYCHQAFRALNQAAGRCIRHRFDYGAIILLDERFLEKRNTLHVSKWLRKSIRQYDNFETSLEELRSFFSNIKERVGYLSIQQDSVTNTENVPPENCGKGSTKKKTQSFIKSKVVERITLPDNITANHGLSPHLHLNAEVDSIFSSPRSQGNEEVQASLPVCVSNIDSHREFIDLEADIQEDVRCSEGQFTTCYEDIEVSVVRETPGIDGGSPESFKDENSSSAVIHNSADFLDQEMLYSVSSARSPFKMRCSFANTPSRSASENINDRMPEMELSMALSVNSHAQKRRKFLQSPLSDIVQKGKPDVAVAGSAHQIGLMPHLVEGETTSPRIESGLDTNSLWHEFHNSRVHQPSLPPDDSRSCLSDAALLDQRLQIFCCFCRNPLGLPENQHYVTCSSAKSSKVTLISVFKAHVQSAVATVSSGVPVIMVDSSSVNKQLCDTDLRDIPGQGIWCKDDGCVYNTIFCPFCSSNNCLGVQIVATDASNFQLINKIFFFKDRLEFNSPQVLATKVDSKNFDKIAVLDVGMSCLTLTANSERQTIFSKNYIHQSLLSIFAHHKGYVQALGKRKIGSASSMHHIEYIWPSDGIDVQTYPYLEGSNMGVY